MWDLLEGTQQLPTDSIAMSQGDMMRNHPVSPYAAGLSFVLVSV